MEKQKTVKIRMPLTRNEKEDVFAAVNGKTYLIKRGEEVELPVNVVRVLERSEKMQRLAMEFEEKAARPLEELEARAGK